MKTKRNRHGVSGVMEVNKATNKTKSTRAHLNWTRLLLLFATCCCCCCWCNRQHDAAADGRGLSRLSDVNCGLRPPLAGTLAACFCFCFCSLGSTRSFRSSFSTHGCTSSSTSYSPPPLSSVGGVVKLSLPPFTHQSRQMGPFSSVRVYTRPIQHRVARSDNFKLNDNQKFKIQNSKKENFN